jgi:hypothetical protein
MTIKLPGQGLNGDVELYEQEPIELESDNVIDPRELSKPYFGGFSPEPIASQLEAFQLLENWDYKNDGVIELLLSGSVGSSKSILMAFYHILHCLRYRGARAGIGRLALPALKKTIFSECIELLVNDPQLREGRDWKANATTGTIKFPRWGSEIISISWADRRVEKVRSLKLSALAIEEFTENDDRYKELIIANLFPRVERILTVPQNYIIGATNPADDEHWLYEYFIEGSQKHKNRKVVYSLTKDNIFLPKTYEKRLRATYTPREAMRYLEGQWISLRGENLYSQYDPAYNQRKWKYKPNPKYPIILTWDFNIGAGKPMSMAMAQYVDDVFHIFNESIIHSARTENILEDLDDRGLLSDEFSYIICGDAAGRHRDTRSKQDDYGVIKSYLERKNLNFEVKVPRANPPIRKRHGIVNRLCCNADNIHRLYIYEDAPTAHKGMRLTKLKEGANYIEDDSFAWQHVTTSIGYMCIRMTMIVKKTESTLL